MVIIFVLISACKSSQIETASVLDLTGNNLKQIPSRYISKSHGVESLILSDNKFEKFPDEILQFENLKSLGLKNNDIREIPESIEKLQNLRNLDLRGTKIKSLPKAIKKIKTLPRVIMFGISLTDVERDNIKCVLPPSCEVRFIKDYRDKPPYECN